MIHPSDSITNRITFGTDGASLAAFRFMLYQVQRAAHPLGSIDFNKLIPTPQDLSIEHSDRTAAGLELYRRFMKEGADLMRATLSIGRDERSAMSAEFRAKWEVVEQQNPEIWLLGKQAYMNVMKYDCPTWYEWRKLHWGTASNATDFLDLAEGADTMVFRTAETAVPKLVQAMSGRFPGQKITYSWADGGTGQHLGRMVFKDGKAIQVDIPQEPGALAQAMSAGIWRFQAAADRSPKKAVHRGQSR